MIRDSKVSLDFRERLLFPAVSRWLLCAASLSSHHPELAAQLRFATEPESCNIMAFSGGRGAAFPS
jgi:hypothetical protein